jgi:hypothetical protein
MAIVDSQGRLFGKVSLLDIAAGVVILAALLAIFVFPGASGSLAQAGTPKPVEVDVLVRVPAENWRDLFKEGEKTKLIIRNQPFGEITIKSARELPTTLAVPQPDGNVKIMPDPRPEANLSKNLYLTLAGTAQITKDGPILGNNKVKVGTPIELEGFGYNFPNLVVLDLRIQG